MKKKSANNKTSRRRKSLARNVNLHLRYTDAEAAEWDRLAEEMCNFSRSGVIAEIAFDYLAANPDTAHTAHARCMQMLATMLDANLPAVFILFAEAEHTPSHLHQASPFCDASEAGYGLTPPLMRPINSFATSYARE